MDEEKKKRENKKTKDFVKNFDKNRKRCGCMA